MNIKTTLLIIFFAGIHFVKAQETIDYPIQTTQSHNLILYNQFLLNPAWYNSSVNESYISVMHRRQWSDVSGAPKNYLLSYATKASLRKSAGVNIFHQSYGAFSTVGGNVNIAYGIQLSRETWLRLGTNIEFVEYSLDRDSYTNQLDPAVFDYQDSFLLAFKPALSLQIEKLALGFFAHNLVTYNATSNRLVKDKKRFSGLVSYQWDLLGDDLQIQGVGKLRKTLNDQIEGGLTGILQKKGLGWFQGGYDTFYGFSAGVGVEITPELTVSYLVENNFSGVQADFGASHELMLAFRFGESKKSTEQNKGESTNGTYNKNELENLKSIIQQNRKKQEELQQQIDSLTIQQEKGAELSKGSSTKKSSDHKYDKSEPDKPLQIKTNKKEEYENIEKGFYLIANVFSQEKNAINFLKDLQEKGLKPGSFIRKENKYHYVYLKKLQTKAQAVEEVNSDLDGKYSDDVWVLEIK